MPSSSRIIPAEEVEHAQPFMLDSIQPRSSKAQRSLSDPGTRDDALLRQSFELGYRRGFAESTQRATQARAAEQQQAGGALAQRMNALQAAMQIELQRFEEHAADRVIDLAVELARKMVGATFNADRGAIVPVAQEALAALLGQPVPATLRLHPLDLDVVEQQLAPILQRRQIELVADTAIDPGGCLLSSAAAEVDARVDERWRRVLAAIGRVPDDGTDGAIDDDAGSGTPAAKADAAAGVGSRSR